MMRKLLCLLIFIMQMTQSQVVSKDNNFATNGVYTMQTTVNLVNDVYGSKIVQNSDGSFYVTYTKANNVSGNNQYTQTVLSKISSSGVIDSNFGVAGEVVMNTFANPNSGLQKQADGKILMLGFHLGTGSDTNAYADVFRFLPNGQPDSSFGNNGVFTIANVFSDYDRRGYYGLLQQNNKIIVYGEALNGPSYLQSRIIYRIHTNGTLDTSFGNGGAVSTQGRYIFLDDLSNIVSFADNTPSNGLIQKYDANGQVLTTFGNSGSLNMSFVPGPTDTAIMDSNNRIVYSNVDGEIGRILSNGSKDTSFVFSPAAIPFPISIFSIVEKSNFYYIGGRNQDDGTYFISRLTANGTVDSVFNFFTETNPNLMSVGDMIINDTSVIANGSGYLVKYTTSNSNLLISDHLLIDDRFVFQNPVKHKFTYQSKDKVKMIKIFSLHGSILKSIKNSDNDISFLPEGIYIAKIYFENGNIISKKLVKE